LPKDAMGERLMTELFFKHRPNAQGELEEKDVVRLNRILAKLYESVEEETERELPPPEPLPKGNLGYGAFRSHLHRALAALASDVDGKERLLGRLIEEVQKPEPAKQEAAEAQPPAMPLMQEEGDVACIEDLSADLPPCIKLPVLLGNQRLQAYVERMGDGKAGDLAKTALISSRRYGQVAIESSKQALERAKEYSLSVSTSFKDQLQKITPEQGFRCMPRAQDDCQVVVEETGSLGVNSQFDEQLCGRGAMETVVHGEDSFGDEHLADLAGPGVPSFGSPLSFCGQHAEAIAEEPEETHWRFDAGDGKHIDLRTHPDISAPRTGGKVLPGECFAVCCEHMGTDGVLYLQLADGRGWLFDHKPGFGPMCLRT